MIINYKPQEPELEIGRPYTFTVGDAWFMRTGPSDVIFLGSGTDSPEVLDARRAMAHISVALNRTDFRYATSMEIK